MTDDRDRTPSTPEPVPHASDDSHAAMHGADVSPAADASPAAAASQAPQNSDDPQNSLTAHNSLAPQNSPQDQADPANPRAGRTGPVRTSGGPLAGIRVVELAGIGPAPMAAMTLAELGADVVRVDRPEPSPVTDGLDRGRRSVVVDLKHPEGAEAVLRLVERADVLIEAYRPGVAERLGVGPKAALRRNPRLVYGRMTGWGQSGPRATTAGHDINYAALTGALSAIGRAGGPPQVPVNLLGDFAGGSMYLLVGVLSALHHAGATGQGQVVDAAIVDGVTHLSSMVWAQRRYHGWTDERGTNLLDTGRPFYDVYETSDGGWFAVGALEPQFYARLVELLGLPQWAEGQYEPARWPAMRKAFTAAFASRTRDEWERVFDGSDACASPVLDWAEAVRDPHLSARGTHDRVDGGDVPSPAPRFSATPTRTAAAPGPVGGDGRQVLADWAVRDAAKLVAAGAVVTGGEGPDTSAGHRAGRPEG